MCIVTKFEIRTRFAKVYMKIKILFAYAVEDKIPGFLFSSAYANKICYFYMNFCKTILNLKFCDNVYL